MADLRIVDAPVLLQESITDDVKMPTGGLGNFSVRLGDILWYVITKEQLANKNYVDLSSKGVKDSLDAHIADKANPHQVTKAQVGLGNVDNTADIDKPVSDATKSAIITATTDMATKTYVNSKYGDLTTLKTADKTNLVKAVNEIHDVTKGVVALYDKNVETGANGWDANLVAYGETTQKQINDGLESITQLIAIKNPRNGMRAYVKSYHAGLGKGGGTFVYDASKSATNDLGTVINGWVRQDFNTVTVWDFGYKVGDKAASDAAIKACFNSSYPTELLDETLDSHSEILGIEILQSKTIFGKGRDKSILKGTVLICKNGSFILQDFKIVDTKLNYGITIRDYDNVYINNYECEICYDAVMLWFAKSDESKALIENCVARKCARIGFTADDQAKNVIFKNCTTYDSYQGFHLEGVKNITLENCTAVRCGQSANAPAHASDQPLEYAGGFRLFVYDTVTMINCRNVDKAGISGDQLGSASKTSRNLTMDNCHDIIFEAEVVPADVYENIDIRDCKNVGIKFWEVKAQLSGDLIIDNTTDLTLVAYGDNSVNLKYASITNTSIKSIGLKTSNTDATLSLDNVTIKSGSWNVFDGFKNVHCGTILSYFTDDGTGIYPNFGYAFRGNNLKNISIGTFSAIGKNGGYQLAFLDTDPLVLKQITIGSLNGEDLFSINNPQNIPIKINSKMGVAVANATATDDTATKLNALLTSLRNAKVIAP